MNPISITAIASISALGTSTASVWESYRARKPLFSEKEFNGASLLVSQISTTTRKAIETLQNSNHFYKKLDDSVLYAIFSARETTKKLQNTPSFEEKRKELGINIGSSRGATTLFEKYHRSFLQEGKTETLTSPTTTLGNISTWVAQDLESSGPVISHSITCSTALHAILNGIAWLNAGMSDQFMVGGSEAPLTDFTLAQLQALKLYARKSHQEEAIEPFYCESLKLDKKSNSMILGEAAGTAFLEIDSPAALANITGIGYATEKLTHNISISPEAECFQDSMNMALKSANLKTVDVVVLHAPGTVKGDLAEWSAIQQVFPELPALTTNKWMIGHSFGASGIMSVEMAVLMLQHQEFIENPFYSEGQIPQEINSIMVNAVGFGGNAVSLILQNPT